MSNKYINFCLTADKNYVNVIAVTMASILKNLSTELIPRFYVFSQGFDDNAVNRLAKLNEIKKCEIVNVAMEDYIHYFDSVDVSKFANAWISLACCFRLLIYKILPDDVEKCFYVDGDMIVDCDLSKIWDLPEDKLASVVVETVAMQHRENTLKHCYQMDEFANFQDNPMKFPYFNAGFILFNIKMCKELNFFEKTLNLLNSGLTFPYADQDILNILLGQQNSEKLVYLPAEYNVFCNAFYDEVYDRAFYSSEEIRNSQQKPKIYHYGGELKPWSTHKVMHHIEKWHRYYKESPFYEKKLFKLNDYSFKYKFKRYLKENLSLTNKDDHKIFKFFGLSCEFNLPRKFKKKKTL